MSDWQRRYDESIGREAASRNEDGSSSPLSTAMEASGLLPGWAGVVAFCSSLAIAAAVAVIRRIKRRAEPR